MTTSSNTSSAQQHASVNPSEVGWQFVPQYYNFVNKEPHRLHCFYTKESTLIHGTEGEQDKACFGQQEIHNKITAIGFQDCKVFIHSVDAQSSANGGIIIQVIGEMSNHNEQWRKFVQTFFLAEQPNGYFVLNDIFRYLKEESFESDDASESAGADTASTEWSQQQQQQPAVQTAQPAPEPTPAPAPVAEPTPVEPTREPTPPPAVPDVEPTPVPAAPADEAPTTDVTEPAAPAPVEPAKPATPAPPTPVVAPAQPNGVHHEEKPKSVAPSPAPVPNVNLPSTGTPAAPAPAALPAAEKPTAPVVSATPSTAPQPPAAPAQPAPQPTQPPAPKTWASLAASNKGKWGNAVAQDSRGTTEVLSSSSPAPSSGQQTPVSHGHARAKPQGGDHAHPAYVAATQVNTAQCFIKGVTEAVTEPLLAAALSKFGALKGKPDVVHSKICAFVEFASVESARRAIISSLNTSAGGDGGVWIDVSSNPNAAAAGGSTDSSRPGQVRVFVETKKERGDRPVNRRGGAPQGGQQQGGQQGQVNGDGHHRGGSGFRGRNQGGGRGRGGKA
ncbi:hypothetical protein CVT24_000788 [Panaeolus cyanescens]|uniref:NTF2 domain-containing protein n=1 Tax=Panaeolus cyanescens TaxID=181874 RepID=A0A409YCM8_9AGAR|nr:hypothetical protein CVT24_000788 [Panaeolus cyanescens]